MRDADCDLCRRQFLGLSLGGSLALALSGLARAEDDGGDAPGRGQADRCIVLYMAGGMSQTDTFDPKPGTKNSGPLSAIKTRAKGLELSELLPGLAEQAHHLAVIRSMATKEGAHERARYLLHTGYIPSGTVKHPDLGALIAQGSAHDTDLPPYVAISGGGEGAGAAGVRYAPFRVGNATQPVENLTYPKGVDSRRWKKRRKLLEAIEKQFVKSHPGDETAGHQSVYIQADRLMHADEVKAFDLSGESSELRAKYGQNPFGQGCLMARRLVEAGVKVAEVQLGGWDTHEDNFTRNRQLAGTLDAGFSTLLADLEERELLKKTLVVLITEFGRTPRINGREGRDHWAMGWSTALAGGSIRGGRAIGATNGDGTKVAERPITAPDLHRSVFHALGLDPDKTNFTPNGRPIRAVDQAGKVIRELFA
jgi:acetyl esterase/lipase